ncbi:metallopeptidase TldD-related protein [Guggenheimella bovis]
MIKRIQDLLEKKGLSGWIIKEKQVSTKEVFFIKENLDLNRARDSHDFTITVFLDFEEDGKKYKGHSSIAVGVSDDFESIEKNIDDAILASHFIKNAWYDLPEKEGTPFTMKDHHTKEAFLASFDQLTELLFKARNFESKINSVELFGEEGFERVITSKGVDVKYPYNRFSMELVTEHPGTVEPVEIFKIYTMTELELDRIDAIVHDQLEETDGRAKAVQAKMMKDVRLLLRGDAVEEFLQFYLGQASAGRVYQKMTKAKIGESFQKNPVEPLTITLNPTLETANSAAPVDEQGKILSPYVLIENGVVKNLNGSARFTHYLGIENKGIVYSFEVNPGKKSEEELKSVPYLEILSWSSFLSDGITGDFGGEYRLAKYYDGKETHYLTGGSISENIFSVQDHFEFSKELMNLSNSRVPQFISIDHVTAIGEA